ncbi:MAG: class I SAM-dependent methyltransferase [Methanomassiliicoccales archaeon]|nr:MAG: class I SAM-dependent methyltransferase [Methanomassiliicoccales archaeon]
MLKKKVIAYLVEVKKIVKKIIPMPLWIIMIKPYLRYVRYRHGRPELPGETIRAKPRRLREGFFKKYCQGKGLDIGYGGDILSSNCVGWEIEDGDAHYLASIRDSEFDFVYSSHTLEHMPHVETALRNWWRVLKSGGYLILYLPHRDLFEKKKTLPSRWNTDHKHYFLVHKDDPPDTIGVVALIQRTLSNQKIIYAKACSEGHTERDPEKRSDGEYSIEAVIKKL